MFCFRFGIFLFDTKVQFWYWRSLEQRKTFRTGKKNLGTVVKSSILFNLEPRGMETFRSDNQKLFIFFFKF